MNNDTISYGALKSAIDAIHTNVEAINEIKVKGNNTSMTEAMQMHLMDIFGYTQIQAQEVIEMLTKGLSHYSTQRQTIENTPSALQNSIRENLSLYSNQERIDILVNILTALQMVDSTNENKDIESLRQDNTSLTEDELILAVINTLDGLPFLSVVETVGKELDQDSIVKLEGMRDMMTDEYKLAASVHLYIVQQQGKLNLGDGNELLSPEIIGAMTGAAIDAIIATEDFQNGRIDLKKWQRILKYILGALFVVSFCVLSVLAIASVNMTLVSTIMSIFGAGMISGFLSIIAMIAFCFKASQWYEEASDYAMEKMSGIYDKVITKLTDWADLLRSKIEAFIAESKQSAPTETQKEGKEYSNISTDGQSTGVDTDVLPAPEFA